MLSVEPGREVSAGQRVTVKFAGANPNNNLRLEEGYLRIEKDGELVAHDSSWETLLTFHKNLTETTTVVSWNTADVAPGTYTVILRGDWKDISQKKHSFSGSVDIRVR